MRKTFGGYGGWIVPAKEMAGGCREMISQTWEIMEWASAAISRTKEIPAEPWKIGGKLGKLFDGVWKGSFLISERKFQAGEMIFEMGKIVREGGKIFAESRGMAGEKGKNFGGRAGGWQQFC